MPVNWKKSLVEDVPYQRDGPPLSAAFSTLIELVSIDFDEGTDHQDLP